MAATLRMSAPVAVVQNDDKHPNSHDCADRPDVSTAWTLEKSHSCACPFDVPTDRIFAIPRPSCTCKQLTPNLLCSRACNGRTCVSPCTVAELMAPNDTEPAPLISSGLIPSAFDPCCHRTIVEGGCCWKGFGLDEQWTCQWIERMQQRKCAKTQPGKNIPRPRRQKLAIQTRAVTQPPHLSRTHPFEYPAATDTKCRQKHRLSQAPMSVEEKGASYFPARPS